MFASNLRNEFAIVIFGYSGITKNFLLTNSGRSIPTLKPWRRMPNKWQRSFNRINSGRSIPTVSRLANRGNLLWGFNRINSGRSIPTQSWLPLVAMKRLRFNRINSGRSIPTPSCFWWQNDTYSVSIVSIQADQSRLAVLFNYKNPNKESGFNRINSGRSIPTVGGAYATIVENGVSIISIQADQSRPGRLHYREGA